MINLFLVLFALSPYFDRDGIHNLKTARLQNIPLQRHRIMAKALSFFFFAKLFDEI